MNSRSINPISTKVAQCPSTSVRCGLAALSLMVALTGCFRHENDPGQGSLTVGENKELDDAAAMLDARPKAPAPPSDLAQPANAPAAQPQQQEPQPSSAGGISNANPQKDTQPRQPR